MQQAIENIANQVTEKWNNLSKKFKILFGVGVVVLVAVIIGLTLLLQPKMKNLFSENVDRKTVGQIATVLDENKITYKIINDSTNVEVLEKEYEQALMYTALAGYPDSGIDFEDVINNGMQTTQKEMTVKEQEYKRKQIQDTIEMMDGIENARVELVVPEQKNAYLQSQVDSRASIFLTLSKPLTSQQCEGIARFITASVTNLKMENIVIIDSQGNTLYSGQEDANAVAIGKQQELKNATEQEIISKVNHLFGNMYDDVRTSPNVVLDFDQYQEKSEEYKTQGDDESRGIVQQESQLKASSTNNDTGAEPGTVANGGDVPQYQVGDGTASESKETQEEIIYSPDKKESLYVKNSGNVDYDKSSVSVILFKNRLYKEEEVQPTLSGQSWNEFKALNGNQVPLVVEESIVSSVRMATGIQDVVVTAYENPIFLDEQAYVIDYKDYLPYAFILLVLALLIFLALRRFRKHEEVVEVEPELEVEEMLQTAKEQAELESIELKETLETKRQIDKFVDEKPEAVANLLRNWLTDDDWE